MIVETQDNVSHFRVWCYARWLDHCDEILEWTGTPCTYSASEYFSRNKWWLKSAFKESKDSYE
jgi:hypothetical protein